MAEYLLESDEHAPSVFRTNAVVSQVVPGSFNSRPLRDFHGCPHTAIYLASSYYDMGYVSAATDLCAILVL